MEFKVTIIYLETQQCTSKDREKDVYQINIDVSNARFKLKPKH